MDILKCTPQKWIEDESNFLKLLDDSNVRNSIPLLNVNDICSFKDSSLVRFQGMIQDMHSPEFYLEKFEVIKKGSGKFFRNGKYCDAIVTDNHEQVNFENESNITSQRQTFVVTSIPGINDWVQSIEKKIFKMAQVPIILQDNKSKRSFDEVMDTEDIGPSNSSVDNQKKLCHQIKDSADTNYSQISQPILSKQHAQNFTLSYHNGMICHIKMYNAQDDLKLNDMCEFVGFLSIDPIIEAAYHENNEHESEMERQNLYPPSSLVPKIHCVNYKKLGHNNPLLLTNSDHLPNDQFKVLHGELLIVFTQLLLGDELAAEYLIFYLLSEVYQRVDFIPLGKFCLNISNIPKINNIDYPSELYKFIAKIVPKSFYLPLTLRNMNSLAFKPQKDYERNCLTSGLLQLTKNTHLVLDEIKLTPGELNSSGINNLKALADVMQHQKLAYDFKYYHLEYDCDIPFLILSEGKSLLGSDVHIILNPDQICIDTFSEIIDAANHFLKPELLDNLRKYLTQVRLIKYEISNEVEEFIQQEFVNMRQNDNISTDDLHSLLVLARLATIADGKNLLDKDSWNKVCEMEKARRGRIVK